MRKIERSDVYDVDSLYKDERPAKMKGRAKKEMQTQREKNVHLLVLAQSDSFPIKSTTRNCDNENVRRQR